MAGSYESLPEIARSTCNSNQFCRMAGAANRIENLKGPEGTIREPETVKIQGGRVTLGVPSFRREYVFSHQGPCDAQVSNSVIARHSVTGNEYELFLVRYET